MKKLEIGIDIPNRPVDLEWYIRAFEAFETEGFSLGGYLSRWDISCTILSHLPHGGYKGMSFDPTREFDDHVYGVDLYFYSSEICEKFEFSISVVEGRASRIAIRSPIFPMNQYRGFEGDLALRQQAVAKELHIGLEAKETKAFEQDDTEQRCPWFKFSKVDWKEVVLADLPLSNYCEDDLRIAEEVARGNRGRFPSWYEEAKRQVSDQQ